HPHPSCSALFPYSTLFRSLIAVRTGRVRMLTVFLIFPFFHFFQVIGYITQKDMGGLVTHFQYFIHKRIEEVAVVGNDHIGPLELDRKSTRLNSSHVSISYD